jgi:hypothetical protein
MNSVICSLCRTSMRSTQQVAYGEPKNGAPFNQSVQSVVRVVRSDGGFDWGSAGIGAASGFGLALAATGGLMLARNSRRRPLPRRDLPTAGAFA